MSTAVKSDNNKEGQLEELGMSSPRRRLVNAKEQAAYFEREVIVLSLFCGTL